MSRQTVKFGRVCSQLCTCVYFCCSMLFTVTFCFLACPWNYIRRFLTHFSIRDLDLCCSTSIHWPVFTVLYVNASVVCIYMCCIVAHLLALLCRQSQMYFLFLVKLRLLHRRQFQRSFQFFGLNLDSFYFVGIFCDNFKVLLYWNLTKLEPMVALP